MTQVIDYRAALLQANDNLRMTRVDSFTVSQVSSSSATTTKTTTITPKPDIEITIFSEPILSSPPSRPEITFFEPVLSSPSLTREQSMAKVANSIATANAILLSKKRKQPPSPVENSEERVAPPPPKRLKVKEEPVTTTAHDGDPGDIDYNADEDQGINDDDFATTTTKRKKSKKWAATRDPVTTRRRSAAAPSALELYDPQLVVESMRSSKKRKLELFRNLINWMDIPELELSMRMTQRKLKQRMESVVIDDDDVNIE